MNTEKVQGWTREMYNFLLTAAHFNLFICQVLETFSPTHFLYLTPYYHKVLASNQISNITSKIYHTFLALNQIS